MELEDRHAAIYEYGLLELGYPAKVTTCGPHGIMLAGADLPDDDVRYFLANTARAALGLETWRDRDYWQGTTDSLNAAKDHGIKVGEARRRPVYAPGNTFTVGSSSFTIKSVSVVSLSNYPAHDEIRSIPPADEDEDS